MQDFNDALQSLAVIEVRLSVLDGTMMCVALQDHRRPLDVLLGSMASRRRVERADQEAKVIVADSLMLTHQVWL